MTRLIKVLTVLAATSTLANSALAQTAREVRGVSPYEDTLKNQPPPRLIVDPPLQGPLAFGVFQAQYRVENLHIAPVFGRGALQVVPRTGHLHVIMDAGPWWWADTSDSNTVDIANIPPGPHKVTIRLVDSNHQPFPGEEAVLRFTIPARR